MAQSNKVEVQIVAVDEASPKIDKLTKKIDGLESDEARIIVTSNIERIDQQLSDALYTLHQLDGDEATVQARLVGGLEDDLIAAKKLFDQLDGATGTVKLDTSGATQGLDRINKSADSSRSALANMVGNSAQDVGQLGGVAGSAGVAIGQMAEYMADAKLAGEGLGSALASFAAVAGPIAALALAIKTVSDIQDRFAKSQKASADDQERWTQALLDGGDAATNYAESLAELGEITLDATREQSKFQAALGEIDSQLIFTGSVFESIAKIFGSNSDEFEKITELFAKAGISAADYAKVVDGDADIQERFRKAVRNSGLATAEQDKILAKLNQDLESHNKALKTAIDREKVFGDPEPIHRSVEAWRALNDQAERYVETLVMLHDEAQRQQDVADATDEHFRALGRLNTEAEHVDRAKLLAKESDAARAATTQYQDLFDTLNEQAARLQLEEAFARAKEELADTKTTALEARGIISDLKLDVARFAEEFKVPFGLTVDVLAKVDTGQLTEAEKVVLGYIPPKPVVVPVVPKVVSAAAVAGATADQLERIAQSPLTAFQRSPSNVTIINPPGTPAATVDSLNKFLEFNGSR